MGKMARIATICQAGNFHKTIEGNLRHIMGLLDMTLQHQPDLVCLPEAFATASVDKPLEEVAEEIPGPIIENIARKAREYSSYIICPLYTKREGKIWNSAVIIDRSGEICGIYDKIHPVTSSSDYTVFEGGVTPGSKIQAFDLDFGRIGIQICFDIGFTKTWEALARENAKMVVWCSAYNGGFALQAYAYLHHYYVVSSVRTDKSRIIDPLGNILDETDALKNIAIRDINLDFVVSHYDFNYSIPDRIMKAYPNRVEVRSKKDDALFLVEPTDPTITVEHLKREFSFESADEYHQRHIRAYQHIHKGEKPPPQRAPHGKRLQYSKTSDANAGTNRTFEKSSSRD
ncbi:MAG: carbon-nitrogen hydrolase family protein [Candidatus Bathyarchaeia archaeon]|nr:carbon-nitrogen hydrolase family protein [Candidatus Bathyarchaeota archaeon]